MNDSMGRSCPINQKTIDEKVVRVIAVQVFLGGVLTIFFPQVWIPLYLLIDFSLRAFVDGQGSLLKWNAQRIKQAFSLANTPTNAAPKQFAAVIGAGFSALILISFLLGYQTIGLILLGILITCAGLEGFLGYCVGCTFYQLLLRLSWIKT